MTIDLSFNARNLIAESPIGPELANFAVWFKAQHYTVYVIEQHLRRLAFVAPRLPGGASTGTHSAEQLCAAFGLERNPRSRPLRFAATRRVYQRFLLTSGRLGAAPRARFFDLLQQYDRYIVDVRGPSVSSRAQHARTIGDLLSSVAYGRAILRYALDTPRTYGGELPPRAVPWSMVQTLLASIDRSSKAGWRDHCILHLIAHYGLRRSEIVALRIDSIDWDTSVLHVHQRVRCPYIPLFGKSSCRLRHTFAMRLDVDMLRDVALSVPAGLIDS
jgi:integrase/recombinase XerD